MTGDEFGQFVKTFAERWPFYQLTTERAKKLKAMFFDFSLAAALAGLEAYDLAHPDLNGQTFKLGGLLHCCSEAAHEHQQDFKWLPCDESQWASFEWEWPRFSLRDFAMSILGKSRCPSQQERDNARDELKKLGAKTPADIARIQRENSEAYGKFRALHPTDSDELRRRNKTRAAEQKAARDSGNEPQKLSFAVRGQRIVESMEAQ